MAMGTTNSTPTRSSVMEQCDVPLRLQHRQKLLEGTRSFRKLHLVDDFMGKLPHIAASPPSYQMPKMYLQKGGMIDCHPGNGKVPDWHAAAHVKNTTICRLQNGTLPKPMCSAWNAT